MISTSPAIASETGKSGFKRYFFVGMAALVILTVFVGFAPSFYLRGAFHPDRKLSLLLHVHGLAFSAWIILFLVQTLLIAGVVRHFRIAGSTDIAPRFADRES
jgi:hypothetical protein